MNTRNFILLIVVSVLTHSVRTIYEVLKHKKILEASKQNIFERSAAMVCDIIRPRNTQKTEY